MKHILKFNGYHVAERLLEDAFFDVEITETPGELTIGAIAPAAESASYMAQINVRRFVPLVRAQVQANIDYLKKYAVDNGKTINDELDEWAQQWPNEPRIELLMEI